VPSVGGEGGPVGNKLRQWTEVEPLYCGRSCQPDCTSQNQTFQTCRRTRFRLKSVSSNLEYLDVNTIPAAKLGKIDTNSQTHGPVNFHVNLSFGLLDRSSSGRPKCALRSVKLGSDSAGINVVQFYGFWANNVL
jgi:hypothetical protein